MPYQIASPYAASDLFPNPSTNNPGLKWVQDVTSLIICHPSYPPQILTIISSTNWTLTPINFGATIATPTNLAVTSSDAPGTTWYYGYLITAVDVNGQESAPTAPVVYAGTDYIGSTQLANNLTWLAVPGAVSYNIYKASPCFKTSTPAGAQYGFVGNVTQLSFLDSYPGFLPDFSQTPPVPQNPFQGAGVQSITVTAPGDYGGSTVPTLTVAAPGGGGFQATAVAVVGLSSITGIGATFGTGSPALGDLLVGVSGTGIANTYLKVTGITGGSVTAVTIYAPGAILAGAIPADGSYIFQTFGPNAYGVHISVVWGVVLANVTSDGAGYTAVPTVTPSAGTATFTAVLATSSAGNPGVPGFIQERLVLAAQQTSVQTFNMSQPGSFFNFNISDPVEDDDAITGSIISEELNDIRAALPVPTGIIFFTGKGAWLVNGGGGLSVQNAITPANVTAAPQAFNGANDLRPIKINMDALYGTNKGNYIRDLTYNIYAGIYTGQDISVLANHLFFGYYTVDWAWAEEPFKTLWVVRSDGQMLSLGFVKEQELIGWAHHDTNGQFLSVCSVIETVNGGSVVDAVYVIVQRQINGSTVQYVERMADRYFTYGYEDSWSVDCALQTVPQVSPVGALTISGDPSAVGNVVTLTDTVDAPFTAAMATNSWVVRAGGGIYTITGFTSATQVTAVVKRSPNYYNAYTTPASAFPVAGGYTIWQPVTTVGGLTQLEGMSVVGVADGIAIGPLTVSNTGNVVLGLTASKITLGLAFLPQLQTLPLDMGEPTVQGKRKKITGLTLRVADTLGLQAGKTFATAVTMKDFQLGAVPTTSSGPSVVSGLVNGDGRTILDQEWESAGEYCIQQNLPYPATILGAMPEVTIGDTK